MHGISRRIIHGATLLYNLMLARKSADEDLIEEYTAKFEKWSQIIGSRQTEFRNWDLNRFWEIIMKQVRTRQYGRNASSSDGSKLHQTLQRNSLMMTPHYSLLKDGRGGSKAAAHVSATNPPWSNGVERRGLGNSLIAGTQRRLISKISSQDWRENRCSNRRIENSYTSHSNHLPAMT